MPTERQQGTDKTSTLLVQHLLQKPNTVCKALLLERARNLVYDDMCSQLSFPRMTLVADLERAGFVDLADIARSGGYD